MLGVTMMNGSNFRNLKNAEKILTKTKILWPCDTNHSRCSTNTDAWANMMVPLLGEQVLTK